MPIPFLYSSILIGIFCTGLTFQDRTPSPFPSPACFFLSVGSVSQRKVASGRAAAEEDLLRILGEKLPRFSPYVGEPLGNGPCHYYDVDGFSGKIGFISAVSHKFCGECNRIRLTSQGFLKTCLQYAAGRDLREVIRSGGSDEVLKAVILEALAEKPDGHAFGGGLEKQKDDKTEKLCMAQIGG